MTQYQLEGAAREAVVTANLLRRGYEVFKAICPNSSFDLVAHKCGVLLRIEVKGDGKHARKTSPVGGNPRSQSRETNCNKFDVLAAVSGDSVKYLRSIRHTFNNASMELVGKEAPSPHTSKSILARRESVMKEVHDQTSSVKQNQRQPIPR